MIATSNKSIPGAHISPEMLQKAKKDASSSRRHLFDVLVEMTSATPETVLASIGELMHYPVASMDDLNELLADFRVIDYSDAVKHECIAFRDAQSD